MKNNGSLKLALMSNLKKTFVPCKQSITWYNRNILDVF
jgi:hypothetical protein